MFVQKMEVFTDLSFCLPLLAVCIGYSRDLGSILISAYAKIYSFIVYLFVYVFICLFIYLCQCVNYTCNLIRKSFPRYTLWNGYGRDLAGVSSYDMFTLCILPQMPYLFSLPALVIR